MPRGIGSRPSGGFSLVSFQPDSPEVDAVRPSPNHGPRPGDRRPDALVLHYTGMPTEAAALARLLDPASEVSAHYLVGEDGAILQLVPEARRAWHAGAGSWAGESDVNSWSIGVEIANGGHVGGLPPYPDAQVEAVVRLARDIVGRWSIPPARVLAHSDVAPARKEDPGERFPWDRLAAAGIGRFVRPVPLREGPVLAAGDAGPEVADLQAALARLGYALGATGVYDDATDKVVTAFQRRWRQARVDGRADASTIDTLYRLLEVG